MSIENPGERKVVLPEPLLSGSPSSRTIGDLTREREPEYEHMFEPGQEVLGHYYLPPFQRPPSWSEEQSARLIESLHMKVSIGNFVVTNSDCKMVTVNTPEGPVKRMPKTCDWLLDGQQRMRAILRYIQNDLVVFKGTPHEHRYDDLDKVQKRIFRGLTVGYTVIPAGTEDEMRRIYDLMNFGGTAHTEEQRASNQETN